MNYWERRKLWYRRREKVICAVCDKAYDKAYNEYNPKQGWKCASVIFKRGEHTILAGGYGSVLCDCDAFRFIQPVPKEYINANPVCDNCVKYLIDNNIIEQLAGSFPFGLSDDLRPLSFEEAVAKYEVL